jgi:hypothetical protein
MNFLPGRPSQPGLCLKASHHHFSNTELRTRPRNVCAQARKDTLLLDIRLPMIIRAHNDRDLLEMDVNTLVSLVSAKPLVLRISAEDGEQELGQIVQSEDRTLRIVPLEGSPLESIDPGPYTDRGAAMAAISAHLRGMCLHARPSPANVPTAQEA